MDSLDLKSRFPEVFRLFILCRLDDSSTHSCGYSVYTLYLSIYLLIHISSIFINLAKKRQRVFSLPFPDFRLYYFFSFGINTSVSITFFPTKIAHAREPIHIAKVFNANIWISFTISTPFG